MPVDLQQVIGLGGGNEYGEGHFISDIRPCNSEERRSAYAARKMGIRAGDDGDSEDCEQLLYKLTTVLRITPLSLSEACRLPLSYP